MGDDWREFRARLVARERAEEMAAKKTEAAVTTPAEAKEEKLGNFISGAISSIFSKRKDVEEKDMFDGQVGGASKYSSIPGTCEDPFMTVEECHLFYDEPNKVDIDKHRWAHPIGHLEPGCVLLANEKLGGVFHQTVVLIIDHSEKIGSTGMIINRLVFSWICHCIGHLILFLNCFYGSSRPYPGDLFKIATESENCNIDLSLKTTFGKAPVSYGGPVMHDQFSTLHGFGLVEGSKRVCRGVYVGGSGSLMLEVRRNVMQPTEVLFVKGHAAWVPGQLSREIEKGVWYVAAVSADFILRYAGAPVTPDDNPADLWADILSCMGDTYEGVAKAHSGSGDTRRAQ